MPSELFVQMLQEQVEILQERCRKLEAAMGTLIFDLDIEPDAAILHEGQIKVKLGNGVVMNIKAPEWVEAVKGSKLQVILEVLGSPPNDKS